MRPHAFFALFLIVFGCVKIPKEQAYCLLEETPPVDIAVEEALASGAFVIGDFPSAQWWEMFDDEQLDDLICIALESSPTLQVAKARVETAEQEAVVTRSRLFPTIGFNVGVNWRYLGRNDFFRAYAPTFPASIPEYTIDVDFQYEFDFWGKNRNNYRAALGEAKAQEAEYEAAKIILTTSVSAVYFKLQALLEKRRILESERDNFTKLFELTTLREKNALDGKQTFLISQEHLYLIDQNVIVTEEQIKLAQNMLKQLIGQGPDASLDLQLKYTSFDEDFPLPCQLSSDLLARRPDLMAMIWRVEKAAYLVGAAKADFYPRIDLAGLAGLDSVFFSKIFTKQSFSANVYPALHLPLFTAGRIRANYRASEAEFQRSIHAYNNALLDAVRDVADQIVSLQKRAEEVEVENRLVYNRVQNQKLTDLRYKNALANFLEVLKIQNEVFEEKFKQIGLQYEKKIAALNLIKSLGGGYCNGEELFE